MESFEKHGPRISADLHCDPQLALGRKCDPFALGDDTKRGRSASSTVNLHPRIFQPATMRSFLALSCGLFIAGVKAQNLFNLPAINPSLIAACFPSGQSASTSPCMDAQSALYKCYSAFDPNNLNATQNCFCAAGANNYLSTSQGLVLIASPNESPS